MTSRQITIQWLVTGVLLTWVCGASGAVISVAEIFDTQAASDSWTSYHYDDGISYYPVWTDGSNPFISTSFGYDGSYLYADAASSGGIFSGDYMAAGATGVGFEVHCDNPSLIDIISLAIYSGYNQTWYYWDFSLNDLAWHSMEISLDDPQWYSPGSGALPMEAWTNVEMIGIEVLGADPGDRSWIAMDNFVLTPEPTTAALFYLGAIMIGRRRRKQ